MHHNALRDVFAQFCQRTQLGGQHEVGHWSGADSSYSWPADILMSNWLIGKPAACDLTAQQAGSGVWHDQRRTRPAVLVLDWVLGKPAAFDITVTSPLNPSTFTELK